MSIESELDKVAYVPEEAEEDDDDFGSFDDASMDEADEVQNTITNIFDSDDRNKISSYINEVLEKIIPLNQSPVTRDDSLDLLNERSNEILQRLTQMPTTHKKIMNEHTWKKSTIRREMILNLGLPLNLDEITDPKTSNKILDNNIADKDLDLPEFSSLAISKPDLDKLLDSTTSHLDDLNIQKTEYYRYISSNDKLEQVKTQLDDELTYLKKMYVSWKEYESNLKKDNNIFQDYIENMVGNELKFRNEKSIQTKLKLKSKKK